METWGIDMRPSFAAAGATLPKEESDGCLKPIKYTTHSCDGVSSMVSSRSLHVRDNMRQFLMTNRL